MRFPTRFRSSGLETGESAPAEDPARNHEPDVLAITSDDRLYYLLLSACIGLDWRIIWAKTMARAIESCVSRPAPLVVYDERLPGYAWREVLPAIARFPNSPAVLLAASEVNEELWAAVSAL